MINNYEYYHDALFFVDKSFFRNNVGCKHCKHWKNRNTYFVMLLSLFFYHSGLSFWIWLKATKLQTRNIKMTTQTTKSWQQNDKTLHHRTGMTTTWHNQIGKTLQKYIFNNPQSLLVRFSQHYFMESQRGNDYHNPTIMMS